MITSRYTARACIAFVGLLLAGCAAPCPRQPRFFNTADFDGVDISSSGHHAD
jgi:hypothetical protein